MASFKKVPVAPTPTPTIPDVVVESTAMAVSPDAENTAVIMSLEDWQRTVVASGKRARIEATVILRDGQGIMGRLVGPGVPIIMSKVDQEKLKYNEVTGEILTTQDGVIATWILNCEVTPPNGGEPIAARVRLGGAYGINQFLGSKELIGKQVGLFKLPGTVKSSGLRPVNQYHTTVIEDE